MNSTAVRCGLFLCLLAGFTGNLQAASRISTPLLLPCEVIFSYDSAFVSNPASAHNSAPNSAISPANPPANAPWNQSLEGVLRVMDAASQNFRTAEADFVWQQYTKLLDDMTDTEKGKIYFRRTEHGVELAADVTQPAESAKSLLIADGKIQLYQPISNRVQIYNEGKNRDVFESYLLLGFGAGGHDLENSFDVTFLGAKELNGVQTGELQLIPKSQKVRNTFDRILLWINSEGVSIQQQLFSDGNYRLNQYSSIQLHRKLSDNVFKLRTNSKTEFISH
jgi:hypothetical protein